MKILKALRRWIVNSFSQNHWASPRRRHQKYLQRPSTWVGERNFGDHVFLVKDTKFGKRWLSDEIFGIQNLYPGNKGLKFFALDKKNTQTGDILGMRLRNRRSLKNGLFFGIFIPEIWDRVFEQNWNFLLWSDFLTFKLNFLNLDFFIPGFRDCSDLYIFPEIRDFWKSVNIDTRVFYLKILKKRKIPGISSPGTSISGYSNENLPLFF